jgi:hypothetical protein
MTYVLGGRRSRIVAAVFNAKRCSNRQLNDCVALLYFYELTRSRNFGVRALDSSLCEFEVLCNKE